MMTIRVRRASVRPALRSPAPSDETEDDMS
jgi:hypothetical protein